MKKAWSIVSCMWRLKLCCNHASGLKVVFPQYDFIMNLDPINIARRRRSFYSERYLQHSMSRIKSTSTIQINQLHTWLCLISLDAQNPFCFFLNTWKFQAKLSDFVSSHFQPLTRVFEKSQTFSSLLFQVGDYILSPEMCIERKSLSDLRSSFTSGRLFHQAESMSRHYETPILLIEFERDKAFVLHSPSDISADIQASKLTNFSLNFSDIHSTQIICVFLCSQTDIRWDVLTWRVSRFPVNI